MRAKRKIRLVNWGCVGPALAILAAIVASIVLGVMFARHDTPPVALDHMPGSTLQP